MILTNEQLAAIARLDEISLAALGRIDGIGEARLQKYGAAVLAVCREHQQSAGQGGEANHGA